jgi:hypothetical protein
MREAVDYFDGIVNFDDAARLGYEAVRARARADLPTEWHQLIELRARAAAPLTDPVWWVDPGPVYATRGAIWRDWGARYGGLAAASMTDSGIKELAKKIAGEAGELDLGDTKGGAWFEFVRIIDFCERRGAVAPGPEWLLEGVSKRVKCEFWWRRQLRKICAKKSESGMLRLHLVSGPGGQAYASNRAVYRRLDQNARNTVTMEKTVLQNEDGQRATLADLAAKSTGKKSIRRNELMTRMRGCEEYADKHAMPGVFLTLTCPSRFHSTTRSGKPNKKYDGSTPRDAQLWLRTQWARVRATLKRDGVDVFGLRVAEPHHDACPHWHALLWCRNDAACEELESTVRRYWLADDGDSEAAQKYRINVKRLETGGATGYIAKYIAKNIDDHGLGDDGHIDDATDEPIRADLLGGKKITPAARVEAWATTWGIRQFQAVGQPPVTVWRELRRVTQDNAGRAGQGGIIHRAWVAAQGKDGIKGSLGAVARAQRVAANARESWADYCEVQGGMMAGRAYKVAVCVDVVDVVGRYGTCKRAVPRGVRLNWAGTQCTYSERRAWRVIDSALLEPDFPASEAAARTRVNNCTRRAANKHNRPRVLHKVLTEREIYGDDRDYFLIAERLRQRELEQDTRQGVRVRIEKIYQST